MLGIQTGRPHPGWAEIQKELAILVKAHPLSPETQAIMETLKKTQMEREEKWNVRWKEKWSLIEQIRN